MKIYAISILIVLSLITGVAAQTASESKDLPNFQKVNDKLFRGGQPKEGGWAELKNLGIRTVIDLRDNDDNALREKALVEKAGMRFVNFPLGNWDRPDTADIEKVLAEINSAAGQPVFVHCKRGSDRTGTVIAVYRMRFDGWTDEQAAAEAEKFGIGWWQRGMRDFIRDYYRDQILKK